MRRSRQLKPLSSEHHQALLVAFQLKKGLAGHAESAGAPKDLPGLLALARRFEEQVFRPHVRAEEDVLGQYLAAADMRRLEAEHAELVQLLESARVRPAAPSCAPRCTAFADLLERHVRWEERELFPYAEDHVDEATLADHRRRAGAAARPRAEPSVKPAREDSRRRALPRALTRPPPAPPPAAPRPRSAIFAGVHPARPLRHLREELVEAAARAPFMKRSGFTRATTKVLR